MMQADGDLGLNFEPADVRDYRKSFLVVTCGLLFIVFSVLVLTKPIVQDEGVFLTIGKYLNHGWSPYQDLFDHKPPAIYFLFALLFKLFSVNVLTIKIALIVSTLGAAALLQKISDRLKKGSGWIAAAIFIFLMTQFEGYFLIAEPFLLLPLLLSMWLLLRFGGNRRWLFLAGVFLGISMLFKQTSVLSAIPLFFLVHQSTKKGVLVFIGGLILPWLLFAGYLLANSLMADAWHQIVTLTLNSYPHEKLGYILSMLQTNFLWTLPIWVLFWLGLKTKFVHKNMLLALVMLPLPFMFFRHYPHYWVQVLPFVALIVAAVLVDLQRQALIIATMIFCLSIAGGKVAQDAFPNLTKLKEQLRVAEVLREQPTDVMLAENQFTAFYFLLPQQPLNKYLYITEITNADGAEQQTIKDLQRGQTVMILWPDDPNYAYAKKLQAFVQDHSAGVKNFPTLGLRVMTYTPITSQ